MKIGDAQQALKEGFLAGYLSDIGAVYEYTHKGLVNPLRGNIHFRTFMIMNASDWKKVEAAIPLELSRRESVEV